MPFTDARHLERMTSQRGAPRFLRHVGMSTCEKGLSLTRARTVRYAEALGKTGSFSRINEVLSPGLVLGAQGNLSGPKKPGNQRSRESGPPQWQDRFIISGTNRRFLPLQFLSTPFHKYGRVLSDYPPVQAARRWQSIEACWAWIRERVSLRSSSVYFHVNGLPIALQRS